MKAVLHFNKEDNGKIKRTIKVFDASEIKGIYPSTHSTVKVTFTNDEFLRGVDCTHVVFFDDNVDITNYKKYVEGEK